MPHLYAPIALTGAVGPGFANAPEDLARLSGPIEERSSASPFATVPGDGMAATGGLTPGYTGAIQAAQIKTGNIPDGVVLTDGPTLQALSQGGGIAPPPKIKATVGSRGPNRPADLATGQSKLARIGYAPGVVDPAAPENRRVDKAAFIRGARAFQRVNGLRADGYMNPNGPTERTLDAQIGRQQKTLEAALDETSKDIARRTRAGDPAVRGVTDGASAASAAGLKVGQVLARQKDERLRSVGENLGNKVDVRPATFMPKPSPATQTLGTATDIRPAPELSLVASHDDDPVETVTLNGVTLARDTLALYDRVLTATPETADNVSKAIRDSKLSRLQKGILWTRLDQIRKGVAPSAAEVRIELRSLNERDRQADRLRRKAPDTVPSPGRLAGKVAKEAMRTIRRAPVTGDRPAGTSASGRIEYDRPIRRFTVGARDNRGRLIIQPTNDPNALLSRARQQEPGFREALTEIARRTKGAELAGVRTKNATPFGLRRLQQKIDADEQSPESVPDYIAGRFYAASPRAANRIVAALREQYKITRIDNFIDRPEGPTGYRAIHLQVQLRDGMTAEVQIWPSTYAKFGDEQHRLYELVRSLGRHIKSSSLKSLIRAEEIAGRKRFADAVRRWQNKQ